MSGQKRLTGTEKDFGIKMGTGAEDERRKPSKNLKLASVSTSTLSASENAVPLLQMQLGGKTWARQPVASWRARCPSTSYWEADGPCAVDRRGRQRKCPGHKPPPT